MLSRGSGTWEDGLVVPGLIVVQAIYGTYAVVMSHSLSEGFDPLYQISCSNLITSVFLFPFAVALERKKWPSKLSSTLMVRVVLLAMGGVMAFQALMLVGIKKTTPAIASAMPNLAPGLIFIIAWCFRYEKVDLTCSYSRAKILGTLMCLTGAISMSLLQTPVVPPTMRLPSRAALTSTEDWSTGCISLISAAFIISCTMVLQAVTMTDFPAPLTLSALTSLIGAFLTAIVQVIVEGKFDAGSPDLGLGKILCYVLMGGIGTGSCVAFQAWSIEKKGPVLVSMFNPVGTVCAAILAALTLGQFLNLESLAGMSVLFAGLYLVLWAKKKEGCSLLDDDIDVSEAGDIEKPLLK